jgi:UDP-N-acetylglucosamine 4,6-dehydratase/5-epimerase
MKQKILITGGSGFLGKRLGMALKDKYDVVLASRNNKNNLSAKQMTGCSVMPLDVTNIESVRDVFAEVRPNIVIHAAATKFVDLAETFPMECVDVNITGSQNIARVAVEYGTDMVIGVSTDKASPPIRNIYGMSKSVMERMFCGMDGKTKTKFTCVRYGNVAWSTGSVLPIWKKMFEKNRLLETTGPEMRRFFFTIDEAVNLVLTALNNIDEVKGKVLSRMMKAAQIEDILRVWTKNFGGEYKKIEGRPGERIDEYLIGELELPHTRELVYNGIVHYLISFNEKVANPVKQGLSSANTEKLSDQEILGLISQPPVEEM